MPRLQETRRRGGQHLHGHQPSPQGPDGVPLLKGSLVPWEPLLPIYVAGQELWELSPGTTLNQRWPQLMDAYPSSLPHLAGQL